ncbi:MAG: hypothetical protein NTZ50_04990 [Chloroflexi bacterium]|nr:hypothetical protein [Chloroflexota bacterium]
MLSRFSVIFRAQPLLTLATLLNIGLLPIALIGLAFDPRTVLAAPAWAKVTKFAASVIIYGVTLIPILMHLTRRPRAARIISDIVGAMLLLEIALIVLQTLRGTPSHFNYATPFDAVVFTTMGIGISTLWIASLVAALLLLQEKFLTRTTAWGTRLGMMISIIGMALAFFMTSPNTTQITALQGGQVLEQLGAHNVNALVDGQTRMIPLLGWNLDGGDLRVAHFIGLHGLQAIPLLAWALQRMRPSPLRDEDRAVLVAVGAAAYLGVTLVTLWQALRDESIAAPSTVTLAVLGVLAGAAAIATIAMIVIARRRIHFIPA